MLLEKVVRLRIDQDRRRARPLGQMIVARIAELDAALDGEGERRARSTEHIAGDGVSSQSGGRRSSAKTRPVMLRSLDAYILSHGAPRSRSIRFTPSPCQRLRVTAPSTNHRLMSDVAKL